MVYGVLVALVEQFTSILASLMASSVLRAVKKEADGAADSIEASIAKHIGEVQGMLSDDFPYASPSAARVLRPAAGDSGPDPTKTNPEIERRLKLVQDQFELASGSLRELELWIRMREPKIEDGNNFGVDVQTNVLRTVVGAKDFMIRTGAGLADWHYHRGTALGRMCASAEQTVVRKPPAAEEPASAAATADGAMVLAETAQTEKQPVRTEDMWLYIVNLDIKHYFHLRHCLQEMRVLLLTVLDQLCKNRAKVEDPRGNADGGSSMY